MSALFGKKKTQAEKNTAEKQLEVKVAHDAGESLSPVIPEGTDSVAYRIIRGAHISEKATNGSVLNKYTFKVAKEANKIEIKKAIEKLYKVGITAVHIQNIPAKARQVGRFKGHKPGFKKAIVTVKEGEKIDVA